MTRSISPCACAPTACRPSLTRGQRHWDRGRGHEGIERQPGLGQRRVGQLPDVPLGVGGLPPGPATAPGTDAIAARADASAHADVGEMHARSRLPHVGPNYHCRRPPPVDWRQHEFAGVPHRAKRMRSPAATVHERCGPLSDRHCPTGLCRRHGGATRGRRPRRLFCLRRAGPVSRSRRRNGSVRETGDRPSRSWRSSRLPCGAGASARPPRDPEIASSITSAVAAG
jgi:hypothetical protein